MAEEYNEKRHREWLREIQPVGLVVSPPALDKFGLVPPQNVTEVQEAFCNLTRLPKDKPNDDDRYCLTHFTALAEDLLEWDPEYLAGSPDGPAIPDAYRPFLADVQVHLQPTYVLLDPMADDPEALLLITCEDPDTSLDKQLDHPDSHWRISPMNRFLRLLKETGTPAGLLCNGDRIRLVYAPAGETPGYIDFPIAEMINTAGRTMFAAMLMLLHSEQVVNPPPSENLTALMKESRRYQNQVSTKLAAQVQIALDELLRAFQGAQDNLVSYDTGNTPDHIYGGLLNTMMRMVFILYAEDQGMMPDSEVYSRNYSLAGLFQRLREDHTHNPDLMDDRFGAWSQLLTLFRMIYRGAHHGDMVMAARYGELFRPDVYPFLEGRNPGDTWSEQELLTPPQISDGAVLRILRNLLILDGERLSYRALDVETIGSVYEAMMGFQIEQAKHPALALGKFSVVIDLHDLLEQKPADRKKYIKNKTALDLSPKQAKAVTDASNQAQLVDALQPKVSKRRPDVIPIGGLYLQPGEERRKTGSHYTPRELTEPIVRHTLEPILANLGEHPTPDQILALKVCDPAMGSGAFLVEACRFLGDQLVAAWDRHQTPVTVPPDEDRFIHARRLVAGRCIYGIDKNPFAASLAKLSLWLVTLAKDHPFTFLDHALKCGDTLLGLTRDQIIGFHWLQAKDAGPLADLTGTLDKVSGNRQAIHKLGDTDHDGKRRLHRQAEEDLAEPRLVGDLILAAFFSTQKKTDREENRIAYQNKVADYYRGVVDRTELETLRTRFCDGDKPQRPFHIELEFPEVFMRDNPGFDAFVGNPPFLNGTKISSYFGKCYLEFLKSTFPKSGGRMDLVVYFFRRSFKLLRQRSSLGLISTMGIRFGDSRKMGLKTITHNGGQIYRAVKRYAWPSSASVIISVVHISKSLSHPCCLLDGKKVGGINSYLVGSTKSFEPLALKKNSPLVTNGSKPYSNGFVFDDNDDEANSLDLMKRIVDKNAASKSVIRPYIGSKELNQDPSHTHCRYIVDVNHLDENEVKVGFPDIHQILSTKVKEYRSKKADDVAQHPYWKYWRPRHSFYSRFSKLDRFLVTGRVQTYWAISFVPSVVVHSEALVVFGIASYSGFALMQSSFHGEWAHTFRSSMKDDPRYTPSTCFNTFPFPPKWESLEILGDCGKEYFHWRARWMKNNGLGMTETYSLFHNPEEDDNEDMNTLRHLHREMDKAVLKAYGWEDKVKLKYDFLLDYEEDEEDSNTKKPWRYRWTDDVRDQVLGLLLDLNQQRHEEELAEAAQADLQEQKEAAEKELNKPLTAPKQTKPKKKNDGPTLFDT